MPLNGCEFSGFEAFAELPLEEELDELEHCGIAVAQAGARRSRPR